MPARSLPQRKVLANEVVDNVNQRDHREIIQRALELILELSFSASLFTPSLTSAKTVSNSQRFCDISSSSVCRITRNVAQTSLMRIPRFSKHPGKIGHGLTTILCRTLNLGNNCLRDVYEGSKCVFWTRRRHVWCLLRRTSRGHYTKSCPQRLIICMSFCAIVMFFCWNPIRTLL